MIPAARDGETHVPSDLDIRWLFALRFLELALAGIAMNAQLTTVCSTCCDSIPQEVYILQVSFFPCFVAYTRRANPNFERQVYEEGRKWRMPSAMVYGHVGHKHKTVSVQERKPSTVVVVKPIRRAVQVRENVNRKGAGDASD